MSTALAWRTSRGTPSPPRGLRPRRLRGLDLATFGVTTWGHADPLRVVHALRRQRPLVMASNRPGTRLTTRARAVLRPARGSRRSDVKSGPKWTADFVAPVLPGRCTRAVSAAAPARSWATPWPCESVGCGVGVVVLAGTSFRREKKRREAGTACQPGCVYHANATAETARRAGMPRQYII